MGSFSAEHVSRRLHWFRSTEYRVSDEKLLTSNTFHEGSVFFQRCRSCTTDPTSLTSWLAAGKNRQTIFLAAALLNGVVRYKGSKALLSSVKVRKSQL